MTSVRLLTGWGLVSCLVGSSCNIAEPPETGSEQHGGAVVGDGEAPADGDLSAGSAAADAGATSGGDAASDGGVVAAISDDTVSALTDAGSGIGAPEADASFAAPLPPLNDDCAGAIELTFVGGHATASGSTRVATNSNQPADETPGCSPTGKAVGRDVVYSYTLTAPSDVEVVLTPLNSPGFRAVVLVRKSGACASPAFFDQIVCAASAQAGATVTTQLVAQQPGTYFVWVDGDSATSGDFALDLTLHSPTPTASNDTCATAQTITFGDACSQTVSRSGSTFGSANDLLDTCQPFSGPDVVYRLVTSRAGRFTATVTPTDGGSLRPYLYVRDTASCTKNDGGGSLGCINAAALGEPATLVVSNLPAGTNYLVVDGTSVSSGWFDLKLTLDSLPKPPTNETCGTAQALTLVNNHATAEGSTAAARDDSSASCFAAAADVGADVSYRFTTPHVDGGFFNVRAMAISRNADELWPLVTLDSACTADAGRLACAGAAGSPHTAVALALNRPASTQHFVTVDSASLEHSKGPFTLQVDVAPVPARNETCSDAIALPPNVSMSGTTLGARGDVDNVDGGLWYSGSGCSPGFGVGADVAYRYTAVASGVATVMVRPQRGFDVGVAVLSTCAPGACMVSRDFGIASSPETVTFNAVAGHSYFIVIDSSSGSPDSAAGRGGFTVSVNQ